MFSYFASLKVQNVKKGIKKVQKHVLVEIGSLGVWTKNLVVTVAGERLWGGALPHNQTP